MRNERSLGADLTIRLTQKAMTGANPAIGSVLQQIDKWSEVSYNMLIRTLIQKGIGVPSTPDFVRGEWKPLSKKYYQRKKKAGFAHMSFYKLNSDLKFGLEGLKARTVFGNPVYIFQTKRTKTDPTEIYKYRRGSSLVTGGPEMVQEIGDFIRTNHANIGTISISFMPNVTLDSDSPDNWGKHNWTSDKAFTGLTVGSLYHKRHLMTPFLKWYKKEKMVNYVKGKLK